MLRNVSSAGPEARRVMRDCDGLVDSFVWIIKAPIGKNDIDNKVKKKKERSCHGSMTITDQSSASFFPKKVILFVIYLSVSFYLHSS